MNHQTERKKKKRLIVLLLLFSCVVSASILLYSADNKIRQLRTLAQADSMIVSTLEQFNVERSQFDVNTITVDSGFSRKTYFVRVPPRFSKTLLHTELNRSLYPYSVRTPARALLPEDRMKIQLVLNGTVIRTLSLQTDKELILERNFASLLIAFKDYPSSRLIDEVKRFGEPIPIALRVSTAEQLREGIPNLNQRYSHFCYWIEADPETDDSRSSLPPVSLLEHVPNNTPILSFREPSFFSSEKGKPVAEAASEKNIPFIDVNEALILDSNLGETLFKQELEKFAIRAQQQKHPVAIVIADEQSLQWLREKLATFKKGGLYLIHPPNINL